MLAWLLLGLAAYITLFNWATLYANHQRHLRGDPRRISMVFLVPQILVTLAYLSANKPLTHLNGWVYATVALSDIGLYGLLYALGGILLAGLGLVKKPDCPGQDQKE